MSYPQNPPDPSQPGPGGPAGPEAPGYGPPQPPGPEAPGYGTQGEWQQPQAQWEQPQAAWSGEPEYASWLARLGAIVLDVLILLVPTMILSFVLGAVLFASGEDVDGEGGDTAGLVITILSIVIPYLYYGFTMGRKGEHNGQTIGKQVVGIRVIRQGEQPVSFGWAMWREFVKGLIGTVTLLINYLWPLWDKRNQALHDKVMSDFVVKA